jgi:LmbE family N-acetylglucosaminyl deacetylase
MSAPRLLAAFAHPDDAEFLVSGTLFHAKALGWEVEILTLANGDCGSAIHSKEEIARIRRAEAQNAAEYLGAAYVCAGMHDLEIYANPENLRTTVELMRQFDPDVVFTHSTVDYMLDHEETARLVRTAAFGAAVPLFVTGHSPCAKPARATPALYYADPLEGIDALGQRLYPQFYVDVSSVLGKKCEMLSRHASQREWLRSHHGVDEYLNSMMAWATKYGLECGCAYAEGFRQHLGHGYPHAPILQDALKAFTRKRSEE